VCVCVWMCVDVCVRPQSPLADSPRVQEWRRLQDRVALLPNHLPFQKLEVIATLGMGGFGRVELVSRGAGEGSNLQL